ncbi:hypothetical protein ACOSQ3_023479 [Xanthoceras sorbifolium]
MFPTKAPGIDGLLALFYQKFWDCVGNDVMKVCLRCLNEGQSVRNLNATLLTLIPKVPNPTRVSEFQPISLCNVVYKIIAKALSNRLRNVLGEVISENQSAFIPGRLIKDNAIVGFECIHSIRRRLKGKKRWMTLKLDMSKAYDRIKWPFLRAMMLKLGFSRSWVAKIMDCVSTVTYSFP